MNQIPCPMCKEPVEDHSHGGYECSHCHCKFHSKLLTTEDLASIKDAPIRHESLPKELEKTLRSTYEVVGHYLYPTFEQWELGFMRDTHPEREVRVWARIALGFLKYHKVRGIEEYRDKETERDLIGTLISISTGVEPTNDEEVLIKECYLNPVDKEVE